MIALEFQSCKGTKVIATAREDQKLLHQDRIDLASATARTRFAKAVAAKVSCPQAASEVDQQLLSELGKIDQQTDGAASHGGGDDGDDDKQSSLLVALASDAELFHDADSEGYATILLEDHRENHRLTSKEFRLWLISRFYKEYDKAPGSQAVQEALATLIGSALFEGPMRNVAVRLAEHDGAIYLDLADDQWRAVRIAMDGWHVISDPPVKFRRRRGMKSLPIPIQGGSVDELRPFINIADEQNFILVKAWLLGALHPNNKYAILSAHGEHGSAKSTGCEMIRALIDPNQCPLRSLTNERDLMIAARNGWITAFDNLSSIPGHISDSLCRLATGGGFATRELYSDDNEMLFSGARPILFNGIEELGTRPDLIDRIITVQFIGIPPERRRPASELWQSFNEARPRMLGALLDAACTALRNLPIVNLTSLPRMADFAKWVVAGESALGIQSGEFLKAYMGNRAAGNALAIEASSIAPAIVSMMEGRQDWRGTAGELLDQLSTIADERTKKREDWPKFANALSNALRRLVPGLRQIGIAITYGKRTKYGTPIIVERVLKPSSSSSPSSPTEPPTDLGPLPDDAPDDHGQ